MFGTSILVMLFIPARFIRTVFPTFLPYTTQSQVIINFISKGRFGNHQAIAIISFSISGLFNFLRQESNVDELAMELLLLLVILPAVQDQNQGREWLKYLVTRCKFCLSSLKYRSTKYLAREFKRWCEGVSWILSLQSYMFGDNQEAVVEVEEVRAEEDVEEQEEVEYKSSRCFHT